MGKIPYINGNGIVSVTVELKNASNVFLLDESNFSKYKTGKSFKYAGGYYKKTPVHLRVKGTGRWYLIVENSDYKYRWD